MEGPELIAGRFVVEQLAGTGGMGKVYRARDLVTGERVAVKVLRSDSLESARFEREGAVLAELRHPGIVRYVAHGETPEGALYLAMEWLEGEDLSRRLKREELTIEQSVTVALRVADALHEAHRRGVVHRDVKPGNVFLVDRSVERVKVLDFGIARIPDSPHALTRTGFMIGTPGFMAPEQTRGQRDIGCPADVFSLGCVLFRCLTGRAPFIGEDVLATLLKVALEEAPRVRSFRPEVSEKLDDLVARMLAKAPIDRPQHGAAVAAELVRLDRAVSERPRAPPTPPTGFTTSEQRLLCVLVARASGDPTPTPPQGGARNGGEQSGGSLARAGGAEIAVSFSEEESNELELAAVAERFGGTLHILVDGSLFVTLSGSGAGTDQAVKAGRCALAMRALLPGVPMALVAGRAVVSGWVPMGDAIDRGVGMLDRGSVDEVRVDDVIAGLLDARFEVRSDPSGHYLRGEHDASETTRMLLGKPTVCIGRDPEVLRLASFLEECVNESMAQAVLVTAPPGMGKSRLAVEFLRQVGERRPDTQVWTGRADLMSAGSPFAVLASVLRRAAGVAGGEPHAVRQQKIRARVAARLAGPDASRAAEALAEVAGGSALDGRGEARGTRTDARVVGDQMRSAWLSFVRAEATAGPLLLVLEDLQWGDLPSVSFVDAALRELADLPIMVLALARPEVRDAFPRLWAERAMVEVKLGALSRRASERLVRRILGDAPDPVVSAVVARGGGNPFYLEELIRAVAEGRTDALPETVLAVAEARLERLDPEERRVLRAASIFGEVFWRGGVLAVLGGADDGRFDEQLGDLVRAEVIERHHDSRFLDEELAFRNGLVRDAAYAMLTEGDRALGHGLAGTWLEVSGEEDALLLAEHFERGGERARAVGWYRRAAQQALEGSDLAGVIARVERAARCGAEGEVLGALRILEGEAHLWRGESLDAVRCCTEAMAILPRGSAPWCEAAGVAVVSHIQLGHIDRFTAIAHELRQVEPTPDAIDRYVVGSALVMAYLWAGGLYDVARSFLERTEAIADPAALGNPVAMGWLGWARCCRVKYETGDPWRHLKLAEQSAESFRSAGDVRGSIRIQIELGTALRNLGRYADAAGIFREARAVASRVGVHFLSASAVSHLAYVLLQTDWLDEARGCALEAIEASAGSHNLIHIGVARGTLALILLRMGDLDGALREARVSAEALVTPPARAAGLPVLATVLLARGDAGSALVHVEEAMGILRTLGSIPEGEALLRLVHAEALRALGREERAQATIRAARARILGRAALIEDQAMRRSFVEVVEVNRRTLSLAVEWGVGPAQPSRPPPAG
jgi:serine/threonine protein kinase/tetratricopeptide (TPR) repeat protein